MKRIPFRKTNIFLFMIYMLSYLSIFISPSDFWLVGLVNYLIPLFILLLLLLLTISIVKKHLRKHFWIPLLALLFGFYFLDISFNFPNFNPEEEAEFTVLSFNTRYFRERKNYNVFEPGTIKWVAEEKSDIKCFQEFSTNPNNTSTDVLKLMAENGYDSYVYSEDSGAHSRGLAIFSKFPIIKKGLIILNQGTQNNCIYVDVLVSGDTIRIYNFHLKSMGLELYKFKETNHISSSSKNTVSKLGSFSSKRALELDLIINSLKVCPYPYILAGDLNEIIYGNNYYKLRKMGNNSFEEAGSGFGFTFNSILFFIRIDHQFYSDQLEAVNLKVIKEVKSSDHFPLKGWYNFSK